jgi:hypothetical protein
VHMETCCTFPGLELNVSHHEIFGDRWLSTPRRGRYPSGDL